MLTFAGTFLTPDWICQGLIDVACYEHDGQSKVFYDSRLVDYPVVRVEAGDRAYAILGLDAISAANKEVEAQERSKARAKERARRAGPAEGAVLSETAPDR